VNELRKVFGNEFLLDFLVFGAFHFPFRTPVQRLQNRTFFGFRQRDPLLEQVLAVASIILLASAAW